MLLRTLQFRVSARQTAWAEPFSIASSTSPSHRPYPLVEGNPTIQECSSPDRIHSKGFQTSVFSEFWILTLAAQNDRQRHFETSVWLKIRGWGRAVHFIFWSWVKVRLLCPFWGYCGTGPGSENYASTWQVLKTWLICQHLSWNKRSWKQIMLTRNQEKPVS